MNDTAFIPAHDVRIRYLGRWQTGSTAVTITNGAECAFICTGGTCGLQFDTTAPGMVLPLLAVWIDGIGPFRFSLNLSGFIPILPPVLRSTESTRLQPGVPPERHHIRFMTNINSGYPTATRNWVTQRDGVRFQGLHIARGASLLPLPPLPGSIEFLGDSITAGLRVLYTAASNDDSPAAAAPELNWTESASRALGLRALVNGHGGQGITASATDGTPPALEAFPFVFNGTPWSPRPAPDLVVVYQGTNDSAFSTAQYQAYLSAIRAAYSNAWIVAIVPYLRPAHAVPIRSAVDTLADPRIRFLDYSAAFRDTDTSDGLHFNPAGALAMGQRLVDDIRDLKHTITRDPTP